MSKFFSASIALIAALSLCACSGGGETATATPATPETPAASTQASSNTMATVDPMARGAKLYKRCQSCHSLDEGGRHKVGPNLWNIYGSVAGKKDGFTYSAAMAEMTTVWDNESMDGYIANPRKYLPGGKMAFAGLRKVEDRDALQLYLKAQTTPK